MSRYVPFAGHSDSSDLAGLNAHSMAATLHSYSPLGDCSEKASKNEVPEPGVYLVAILALIRERIQDRSQIEVWPSNSGSVGKPSKSTSSPAVENFSRNLPDTPLLRQSLFWIYLREPRLWTL